MTWVKVDDQFYNHPKVADLGSLMLPCVGLHVLALCYCNAYLTDGLITEKQIAKLAGEGWVDLVHELIEVGLWENAPIGFKIHDFLDYNPSKKEVLKTRKDRALSGRAGGLAKAKQNPSKVLEVRQAFATTMLKQNSAPSRPVPSRPDPVLDLQSPQPPGGVSQPKNPRPKKPPDYEVNEQGQCVACVAGLRRIFELTGFKYRLNGKPTIEPLHPRHKECGLELCLSVIELKAGEWGNDPKMRKFIRPSTLFGPKNFNEYRAEVEAEAQGAD